VDASGYAAKYTSSWASPAVIDSGKDLSALSCKSTSFCEAVDTSGRALKYTSSWGLASSIDSTRALNALTCTSSTFCVAVGASGYGAVYTGTWAASTDVDAARTLATVSCASSSFCVAVDGSGYQATYTGTWAAASDNDGASALSGVACPASTYCVAVDGSGNGITYSQPVATLSQLTWDTSSGIPLVIADGADYYVYGPGTTPVEQVSLASSTPTFLTFTPDSSTYVATNAAGDVLGFWGYDAYGNLSYGTPVSTFGYAGQYSDQASGLSNMRARFYQSQTGGFTTRDPAFALTDTAYAYAGDDPINGDDPLGLSWWNPISWSSKTWENIASVAAVATVFIPGVDIVTGAVAITTGSIAAGEDAYHGNWVGAGLDVAGVGLSAFGVGEAISADRGLAAASDAVNGYAYLAPWYASDAAEAADRATQLARWGAALAAATFVSGNFLNYPQASAAIPCS
jgi:RHS repeat-associated protein